MATGVLVVGIGRATRLLTYITGADKEYLATIRLGESTTTDDAEGEMLARADASAVTREAVHAAVVVLVGDIMQVPSAVSAIKVDGVRSYARVRAGQAVELPPRPVHVETFDVTDIRPAPSSCEDTQDDEMGRRTISPRLDIDVRVVCSPGTYIRALARDLGAALGVGGHLTMLRRTRVGSLTLAESRTLDALAATDPEVSLPVTSPAAAASAVMPTRLVTDEEARELSFGRRIVRHDEPDTLAAITFDGTLIAVLSPSGAHLRPLFVLTPA